MELKLSDLQQQLKEVLEQRDVMKISFMDTELYVLNTAQYKKVMSIEQAALTIYKKDDGKHMYNIAKLMNPHSCCYKYVTPCNENPSSKKIKYMNITDQGKIIDSLKGRFEIWKNKRNKQIQQQITSNELYDGLQDKVLQELEDEKALRKSAYDYIKNFTRSFKLRRTTYNERKEYAVLYYNLEDGSNIQDHLRKKVPNILWYEYKEINLEEQDRIDANIKAFEKDGIRIFDDFYIQKKNGFEKEWNEFIQQFGPLLELNKQQHANKKE